MNTLTLQFSENEWYGASVALLVDGRPMADWLKDGNYGIPVWLLEQGLPLWWGVEDDSDADVREVTVCSCGEDGCGHSRCRVRVEGDTVIFEDFAGDAARTAPDGLRFVFPRAQYESCCQALRDYYATHCGVTMREEDEFPVADDVRAEIVARLAALEAQHGVRILYACESGSRGWGFASPDSDYDVRFLYVHPLSWYLRVGASPDVIEMPISDALDLHGWELRKALGLLKKGNATLIEWLDSPVVYRAEAAFLRAMQEIARQTHQVDRSFHHYTHMARKNYRAYLRGDTVRLKKYLYVLRPLLAALWIEQGRGLVPMRFQTLVDVLVTDAALRDAIAHLLAIKRAAKESEQGQPLPVLNAFIERELTRLESAPPPVPQDTDFTVLDRLLMETVLRMDTPAPPA